MELKKSKTILNLAKTFAGECQARTRYEFMEYGARKEGYKALAELIDDVVYNEFNHARMFYTHIQKAGNKTIDNIDISSGYPFKQKWDLLENLRMSAETEAEEATFIYPEYARIADEEGFPEIAQLYRDVIQVEVCHNKMFTQLYEKMKNGTLYSCDKPMKWKCGDCGYEETGLKAFETCPLCDAKQGAVLIDIDEKSQLMTQVNKEAWNAKSTSINA